MSGSCATGIRVRANSPPSVMTMAMTIASRGRSMKTEEITWSAPGGHGRCRCRRDRRIGPHTLKPLDDDALALREAVGDAGRFGRRLAEAHAALPGHIVLIDDIYEGALLIGEDRGARHGDDLL